MWSWNLEIMFFEIFFFFFFFFHIFSFVFFSCLNTRDVQNELLISIWRLQISS